MASPSAGDGALTRLAQDRHIIIFRPRLVRTVGSAAATILLQQIVHWWQWNKRRPFY